MPADSLRGRIQEFQEGLAGTKAGLFETEQRGAEAQSIQAGEESALEDSGRLNLVVLLKLAINFIGDTGQFEGAETAQVVDQKNKLVGLAP